VTRTQGFDWYILIDGVPSGPVTAEALTTLVTKRKLAADDLVWCEGLPSWTPVGAVLGAVERSAPRTPPDTRSATRTHTVYVEAAERRQTAHRVVSLSQLYVDRLAEGLLAPLPQPSSSGIVEAHGSFGADVGGDVTPAYAPPSPEHASARYVAPSQQRDAAHWQPELAELARLVEVSEAGADWNAEWVAMPAATALTVAR
jgi:hypothetical protein